MVVQLRTEGLLKFLLSAGRNRHLCETNLIVLHDKEGQSQRFGGLVNCTCTYVRTYTYIHNSIHNNVNIHTLGMIYACSAASCFLYLSYCYPFLCAWNASQCLPTIANEWLIDTKAEWQAYLYINGGSSVTMCLVEGRTVHLFSIIQHDGTPTYSLSGLL